MFRKRVLPIGSAVLILAVPALAQQSPVKYPPPCDPSQVTKSDVDRAHAVFLSGKQFLEESNYDKAIGYFDDAYSIDCSIHAILPIIATAYERKGDKAEAIRALEEYVKRAPDAADHEIIERRIKNLKDQLAHEAATAPAPPPAVTSAPSASAAPAPEVSAVPVASAPPAVVAPAPASPSTTPVPEHTTAPWIAFGLGGAALATGVVLYAVGWGNISSADSSCTSRACPLESEVTQGNNGRTLVTVGGVVGGVGLAAAAAGLIWHFAEKPGAANTSGSMEPVVGPGYAGAAGTF